MAKYMILKQDTERLLSLITYRPTKSAQVDDQPDQQENWWWAWHQKFVRHLWSTGYCHIDTPLVKLIAVMPEAAETLLTKFIKKQKNGEEYNFKFLEMYMCNRPEVHKALAEAATQILQMECIFDSFEDRNAPRAEHWPPQEPRPGLGEEYYSIKSHPLNIMVS